MTARQSEILSSTNGPNSARPRRAIVVTFDHLHLGYLGCYGNDWIETPHFDRLASRSVVFDRHCCENVDPAAANHAWWNGIYQFAIDPDRQRKCPSVLDALHDVSVKTHLVVESDGRDDATIAPPFGEVSSVRGTDGFDVAEGATPFACTVKKCAQWLADSALVESALAESTGHANPQLLWIKSRGVPVPWVPPRDFAELYLDEFGLAARGDEGHFDDEALGVDSNDDLNDESDDAADGDGTTTKEPDDAAAATSAAPLDDSLDWRYAATMYAAYVTLLDRGLGKLLATIEESPDWKGALLIVTAGAGQALGEHGSLADERVPLRAECLQTPLWVCLPESDQAGTRRQSLVQTVDLAPTLLEWFCRPAAVPVPMPPASNRPADSSSGKSLLPLVRNEVTAHRDMALMGNGRSEWGIRTDDFFYVEPGDDAPQPERSPPMLFEKPHDRWDQFDVLSQFPQVSDDLRNTLRARIKQLDNSLTNEPA